MTIASSPQTRIVIVSGNEYQVPITATEKELREHLASMFPDITNATLQKGKRTVEGVDYETWEFVKRAGTKGATGAELAALLAQVPRLATAPLRPAEAHLLSAARGLRGASCTIGDAIEGDLLGIIARLPAANQIRTGGDLCKLADMLPPVSGSDAAGW